MNIEEEENTKPLFVFHPHSWASQVPVEMEVGGLKDDSILLDNTGQKVPFQRTQSHATAGGRSRICFMADMPSMGYKVFRLKSGVEPTIFPTLSSGNHWMGNKRYRLELDPKTGWIKELRDKELNYSVFQGAAARPVVIADPSDTWSHDVLQFPEEVGTFEADSVQLVEQGPVRSILRVKSRWGQSSLVQDFILYADGDQVEVRVAVDWREQFKMLKIKFPVNQVFRRATYDIPYGSLERPVDGQKEPGGMWLDVSGMADKANRSQVVGVALLNDGKYSFDVHNKELSITVLRSPIYAHHDPMVPKSDGHYSFIDQGIQHFTYAILPHHGGWEEAGVVQRAHELNQGPIALWETYHAGDLPQTQSFLTIDQDTIVVGALKRWEDGDDMILRLWETAKMQTTATVELPLWNRKVTVEFGPAEIKTLRIPKDPTVPVQETSMLEE